jgi:release factor glutamine methyltransferase
VFDGFFQILKAYKEAGFEDPLNETLGLLDNLSGGAVSKLDSAFPLKTGIDLAVFMDRRCRGMPVEYALGYATFMGMQFSCSPAALIPRPETELLAETAIALALQIEKPDMPLLIVDMGTGSGNLAVSMAARLETAHVLACDISSEAIELAKTNVNRHNLQSRISLFTGNLFTPLADSGYIASIDMVVSNPPYLPTGILPKLAPEILNHEPVLALNAGAYGIDVFRGLIEQSPDFLKPGGLLVLEIGIRQEKIVTRLIQKSRRFCDMRYYSDRSGNIRVISAASLSKKEKSLSIVKNGEGQHGYLDPDRP